MNHSGYRYLLVMLFMVGFVAFGCGPKDVPRGEVSGSVLYKGKPVTSGNVSLYSPLAGTGSDGTIQPDGSFSIKRIQTGSYQVSVTPPEQVPPAEGETPKPQPKFSLPAKYTQGTTSGLTFEVKEGPNELKLDLQ